MGFDTKTGRRKTPLVAWTKLVQPREDGGLGFKDYIVHVDALLSRWVSKALEDLNMEWALVFFMLIKDFSWENRRA